MKNKIVAERFLIDTIKSFAGPAQEVLLSDDMPREEQIMELTAGFMRDGDPFDIAEDKAYDYLDLIELARAPHQLPN